MQRQDSNDGDATVRMATQRALPAHQAFLGQRQAHDVQNMTVEDFLLSWTLATFHMFLVLSIQGTCKITCKVPQQQSAFSPLSDCTAENAKCLPGMQGMHNEIESTTRKPEPQPSHKFVDTAVTL